MKSVLIVVGSILAISLLTVFGFNGLAKHIFNRTDCERFNLDNIEVRTGINVPKVESFECSCEDYIKESSFILDSNLNMSAYIQSNKFDNINGQFLKENTNKFTKWKAKLDTEKRKLSFVIEYLDQIDKSKN